MNEKQYAEMEASLINIGESYFAARHEMLGSINNKRLFEAGFIRGYKECIKEKCDRLLVLATKHCPSDHRDFEEIKRLAGDC